MIAITMGTHNQLNFDLRRAYVRPKAVAEWPNLTPKGENCPWIEDGILRVAQNDRRDDSELANAPAISDPGISVSVALGYNAKARLISATRFGTRTDRPSLSPSSCSASR